MQREERIRRNRNMLQQLGVQQAAAAASRVARPAGAGPVPNPGGCAAPKRRALPPEALESTRRSARARGAEPGASTGPGEEERGMAVSPGARQDYEAGISVGCDSRGTAMRKHTMSL